MATVDRNRGICMECLWNETYRRQSKYPEECLSQCHFVYPISLCGKTGCY